MRRRSLGVALCAVVLVAACGDSAEPPAPTTIGPGTTLPSTAPTTTTPPAPPPTTRPAPAPSDGACTPLPAGSSTVDVTPAWRIGDGVRLQITVSRSDDGAVVTDQTWAAEVSVLEVLDEGYRLQWVTDEQVIDPETLEAAGLGEDAIARLDELSRTRIEYVADNFGAFVGIVNVEELMGAMAERLAIFEAALGGDDTSEEVALMRQFLQALASDEALVKSVFEEQPRDYLAIYGALAEAGEPISAPATLPNLLGGEPFPATRVQEVAAIADDEGCAVITTTTEADPAEFARIIGELTDEPGSGAVLEGFSVRAERTYRWDPGSGWMVEVEVRNTTGTPLVELDETKTMTAVPAG